MWTFQTSSPPERRAGNGRHVRDLTEKIFKTACAKPFAYFTGSGVLWESLRDRVGIRPGDRADNEGHLRHLLGWLCRVQDATPDGRVSRAYSLICQPFFRRKGRLASYPETTGYIIATLHNDAQFTGEEEYRRRAAARQCRRADLANAVDLSMDRPPFPALVPLTLRFATEDDFQRFRDSTGPLRRQAAIRDHFGLTRCCLVFSGAELAHFCWIYYPHEQRLQPTQFRSLRRDEVAIANIYTFDAFRGCGIMPSVLRQLFVQLRSEGYRYCLIYIEPDNGPSRSAASKAGGAVVGRSWRIRGFYHRGDPANGIYIKGPCRRLRSRIS